MNTLALPCTTALDDISVDVAGPFVLVTSNGMTRCKGVLVVVIAGLVAVSIDMMSRVIFNFTEQLLPPHPS